MHRNASAARRLVRELRGRDDVEAGTPVLAALVLELGGALDDALADPDVRASYRTAALAGQYRESLVALLERLPTSRDDGWDAAFERLAQRLGDG